MGGQVDIKCGIILQSFSRFTKALFGSLHSRSMANSFLKLCAWLALRVLKDLLKEWEEGKGDVQ